MEREKKVLCFAECLSLRQVRRKPQDTELQWTETIVTWRLLSVLSHIPDNTTSLFSHSSQILAVVPRKPMMLHPQL